MINRNGLRWWDASKKFDPPNTLHNRWKRWCRMGITGVITSRDQEVEDTGLDASMPSDLVESLASLASLMVQHGQSIARGQIVLSGTCIHAIDCPSGSKILADFCQFSSAWISFA